MWDGKCRERRNTAPFCFSSPCGLAFATLIFMRPTKAASAWCKVPVSFPGDSDGPAWVRCPSLSQPAAAGRRGLHDTHLQLGPPPKQGCWVMGTLKTSTLAQQLAASASPGSFRPTPMNRNLHFNKVLRGLQGRSSLRDFITKVPFWFITRTVDSRFLPSYPLSLPLKQLH